MKKIIAILCALLLCTAPAFAQAGDAASQDEPVEPYLFIVEIAAGEENAQAVFGVDMDIAPAVALLGDPISFFESESCAFQGMDKVYTYTSFIVNTYPKDGQDLILSVYLMDDTVETPEGAYIGMHIDDITALYGEPTSSAESSVTYEKGGCALAFILDAEGYVSAITYTSVAASAQ